MNKMNEDNNLALAQEELAPVSELLEQARAIEVKSAQDVEEAGYTLKQLSDTKKKIEDLRVSFTKPINESLRNINGFFRQFSDPVDLVDKEIRKKIRLFSEEFKKKVTVNQRDYAELSLAAKNRVGGVKLKKVWTYKIINRNKVPLEYFMLDEVKIRGMIRMGVREIPGLEIFQEEAVSL